VRGQGRLAGGGGVYKSPEIEVGERNIKMSDIVLFEMKNEQDE
jgi:hypothetical protein